MGTPLHIVLVGEKGLNGPSRDALERRVHEVTDAHFRGSTMLAGGLFRGAGRWLGQTEDAWLVLLAGLAGSEVDAYAVELRDRLDQDEVYVLELQCEARSVRRPVVPAKEPDAAVEEA